MRCEEAEVERVTLRLGRASLVAFCDFLKDVETVPPQGAGDTDGLGTDGPEAVGAGLVLDATDADDGHVLCVRVQVEDAAQLGDVAEGERVQGGAGEAADAVAGLAVEDGLVVAVEQQAAAEGVCGGDEVDDATLAGLARLGRHQQVRQHRELRRPRVRRQLDPHPRHRLGRRHPSPIRRLGVRDGLQVLRQLHGVVRRWWCALDVGAR